MDARGRLCIATYCGRMEYDRALALQMQICELKKREWGNDVLLLLEHPPTITLGRNGRREHMLVSADDLRSRGVECYEVDRGGDITFHGPGQLVGYPLLKLGPEEQDVRLYMRNLEAVLIRVLDQFGIKSSKQEGMTGVWTSAGKIAAMGVHISRWITRHGFALNVNTDLSYFDLIVPCGIAGRGVTAMSALLGKGLNLDDVARAVVDHFGAVFERNMVWESGPEFADRLSRDAQKVAVA